MKFLLSLILLLSVACTKKDKDDDEDNEQDELQSMFDGNYISPCVDVSGGTYLKYDATFDGSDQVAIATLHMDAGAATCTEESMVAKIIETYEIEYGDEITESIDGAVKAYEITNTMVSITAAFYDNGTSDFVTAANSNAIGSECSDAGTWVEGEFLAVNGLECLSGDTAFEEVGEINYGFLDIDESADPVTITPDDTDVDPALDGTTPAKRPVARSEITLIKQ